MIKSITTGALIAAALHGHAQVHPNDYLWYNNGADVLVENNCLLTVQGDITNNQNNATGVTHFTNNGFVWVQGNLYGDHSFKQAGTGTIRLQNNTNLYTAPYANENYQIISGGYQVHGGQSAIASSNDGSFYNLELDNSSGSVFIVDTTDIRGTVDLMPQAVIVDSISIAPNGRKNTIRTYNPGTAATAANPPSNGAGYSGIFGIMNTTSGATASLLNGSANLTSNTTVSDSAYIQGKLRRAIDPLSGGIYGFPVGLEPSASNSDARGIQYVSLDFSGANNYDVVMAYFQQGKDNTIASLDSVCTARSNFEYYGNMHGQWIFSALNNATDTYNVTIYPQDFGTVASDVYFVTATNSTNDASATENENCNSSPLGISATALSGMQSFGFAGGSTSYPLATSLIYFEGRANGCGAMLLWQTASLGTFHNFDIMYSSDGSLFNTVGSVNGSNNTSFRYSYAQPDENGFYRLRMKNEDNSTTISAIVTVKVNCDEEQTLSFYPNPITNVLNIDHLSGGKKTISLINAVGAILHSFNTEKSATTVDLSSYAPGVYNIRIETENGEAISHKVVKLSR